MEYIIFNPYPFVYHFRDPMGVNFTLITGSKKAILFDTGYGITNIRNLIENIVITPYIVINSHGHMDHTSGNYLFNEVYINEDDIELCIMHNQIDRRKLNLEIAKSKGLLEKTYDSNKYIMQGAGNLIPIKVGEVIDLGDMHVRVILMNGHTKGSIGLLIEEKRLLLTGDAAISMIWLFLEESISRDEYIQMLENVIKEPFDNFITGHISRVFPKRYFDYYIEVAKKAEISNSKLVSFEGFNRLNTYQYQEKYENDIIGICFYEKDNQL
jgi:glyoxylase-like metal-dependent hydrolase (beta-lactamase superfamily II)